MRIDLVKVSCRTPARRWIVLSLAVPLAGAVPPAAAVIDLEFRPMQQTALVGETIGLGLYAVSDDDTNQSFSAVQAIFEWQPGFLQLLGLDSAGAVDLLSSGFPINDPFSLNEVVPQIGRAHV